MQINSLIRAFSKAAMFIYLVKWLLSMFTIYGKHVAEPRWPPVVHSMAKLSSRTDSKLQGLVNVNMNIWKIPTKNVLHLCRDKKDRFW